MAKTGINRKRRQQRMRAKAKNPISAVKTKPREDVRRVGIEARARIFGMSEECASHEEAATVIGRLWLCGKIDRAQLIAAKTLSKLHAKMLLAIKAPIPLAVGGVAGDSTETTEDYIDWAVRAIGHFRAYFDKLTDDEQKSIDRIVFRDCGDEMDVPRLCTGLSCLVKAGLYVEEAVAA